MNRALDVLVGVSLIFGLWGWMLVSLTFEGGTFAIIFLVVTKVIAACLITGPVYREYLR